MGNLETVLANADQLFGKKLQRRHETLTLPISGNKVRIRSLSERELSAYQAATVSANGTGLRRNRLEDANRRLIVLCLVDGAGNRICNDNHVRKMENWDAADTSYLYEQCAEHVGVRTEDIEDLVKNSESTTDEEKPSASPTA